MGTHTVFSPEVEKAYKLRFAAAWLRTPTEPFTAGCAVFGADTGRALMAASLWLDDPIVVAEKEKLLKASGPRAFLPSKEDLAREVWKAATETRGDHEAKIKYWRLYADVMNFIERPAINNGIVNNVVNRVMEVPSHGTEADWEKQAVLQQQRLIRAGHDVVDLVPNGR